MSEIYSLINIFSDLSTFFSHELDEKELKDYLDIFKDYDILPIVSAIRCHKKNIKEGMFFPKPAHLLKYINIEPKKSTIPCHQDFPKIEHKRRSSAQTAEKYLKEIMDILK